VFGPAFSSGVVDQDAAHGLGGGGKKVPPTIPILAVVRLHEAQIRLMNQGRRLERLAGFFLVQPLAASLRSSS